MRSDGPVEVPAALDALREGIEGLRGCAELDLATPALTELVGAAFELRNRLEAALTRLVGGLDERMRAEQDPDDPSLSCAAWLREELHLNNGAAWAQVRLARQLRDLPRTRTAFAAGFLSSQHAMAIARTVDRVVVGGGRAADAEPLLLQEAMKRTPSDLLDWGRHLRHHLNPQELADEEEEQHRRRWLHLTRNGLDGSYDLEAHLDAEAGTRLRVALHGVLGPRRQGDERSAPQRRADGLDELVTRVLDSGQLPVRGGQRPHITVTATLETLRGDPGAPAAELDWGLPISGQALRRIACDAELTPILLSANGNPLCVGRARRTASARMRKALAERDRTCGWDRCDRPPAWCAGHHRQLWAEGGGTNVDEMVLLCGLHHRKYHAGYRLRRLPDGRVEEVAPKRGGPVFGPAIPAPPPAA